ncbi:MAG: non-heme iron oxygenase ferredoxin subunit [Acidimicrobiia bacterium]
MIEIGDVNDYPSPSMKRVDIDGLRLCVMNVENDFYVIDDRCSHADFSLSEGDLDTSAKEVECPKHGAIFDITSGEPRSLPATQNVKTYRVLVNDGKVFIETEDENA